MHKGKCWVIPNWHLSLSGHHVDRLLHMPASRLLPLHSFDPFPAVDQHFSSPQILYLAYFTIGCPSTMTQRWWNRHTELILASAFWSGWTCLTSLTVPMNCQRRAYWLCYIALIHVHYTHTHWQFSWPCRGSAWSVGTLYCFILLCNGQSVLVFVAWLSVALIIKFKAYNKLTSQ